MMVGCVIRSKCYQSLGESFAINDRAMQCTCAVLIWKDNDDDSDDGNDDNVDDDDDDARYCRRLYLDCNLGQVTHLLSTSFFSSSQLNV